MKTYENEYKTLMRKMFFELDKQEEKSKNINTNGFYDGDSYERRPIIKKYDEMVAQLKQKYNRV